RTGCPGIRQIGPARRLARRHAVSSLDLTKFIVGAGRTRRAWSPVQGMRGADQSLDWQARWTNVARVPRKSNRTSLEELGDPADRNGSFREICYVFLRQRMANSSQQLHFSSQFLRRRKQGSN